MLRQRQQSFCVLRSVEWSSVGGADPSNLQLHLVWDGTLTIELPLTMANLHADVIHIAFDCHFGARNHDRDCWCHVLFFGLLMCCVF